MKFKTLSSLKLFFKIINRNDKKKIFKIIFFLSFVGLVETAGIASIFPFLAVVSNPEIIFQNITLNSVYIFLESNFYPININLFMLFMGIVSIIAIIFSNLIRICSIFVVNKFIENFRHKLSSRLLNQYLYQPYEYFALRHSSELTKNVMSEIDFLTVNVLRPIMEMISHIFIVTLMVIFLLVINPKMTFAVIIITIILYLVIYILTNKRITSYGEVLVYFNKQRFNTISNVLNGIKYVKLQDTESNFFEEFKKNSLNYVTPLYKFQTLVRSPKYILEALVFCTAISLVVLVLIIYPSSVINDYIPIIGLYVFFAYKIQPGINSIFTGISSIKYGEAVIKNLFKEFTKTKNIQKKLFSKNIKKIVIKKKICLNEISFKYKNSKYLIKDLNLKFKAGDCIGFFGPSGSGKTTLIDLIVGLCKPSKGSISFDNNKITNSMLVNWRNSIGYVQQKVFISDKSFAENIAFGIPKKDIDIKKVIYCAKVACLHKFINSFKKKYNEKVGENGARISGGQNQRIGVARALYKNPEILVLDEATNALDNKTEKLVLDSIISLMQKKTVFLVTHKPELLKYCNNIVNFSKNYDDVIEISNVRKN